MATECGIEPGEVRLRNLASPDEMPFDNITKKHFDSGDYPQAMRRALAAMNTVSTSLQAVHAAADAAKASAKAP